MLASLYAALIAFGTHYTFPYPPPLTPLPTEEVRPAPLVPRSAGSPISGNRPRAQMADALSGPEAELIGDHPTRAQHSEPANIGLATASTDLSVAAEDRGATPTFLTSIINWLAANYDLPGGQDLPRVEFATPMKLVAMRYKGMMPAGWREDAIRDPSVQAAHQRDVVAIYNDRTRTIFLAEGWTGVGPVERSVLVHEIVHHLQNLANLKYECPAAREKLAYEAQSDWLKLHGLDLEDEFNVDLFTIFVTSACMN